jgi:hypothetical protein
VLDLDVTKTVESILVSSSEHSHRIPAAKRRLGTKSVLELAEDSGGLAGLLGRGESSAGGDKGGKSNEFHFDVKVRYGQFVRCLDRETGR